MASWMPPGWILDASGLILEAPKLDLGRFWHDFFEILGQNAKKAKNAKNACQNKTSITSAPRVGGQRCFLTGGFQWSWRQVRRFGIQRLLGSWQFAETVPSHRTPASGWAFPGLARFRPHFSSLFSKIYGGFVSARGSAKALRRLCGGSADALFPMRSVF